MLLLSPPPADEDQRKHEHSEDGDEGGKTARADARVPDSREAVVWREDRGWEAVDLEQCA